MTTVGSSGYGVALSSAQSSGPSGDIVYLFSNDIKRKLVTKDKITHVANQTSFAIVLNEVYYVVDIRNAIVVGNTITTLNSYHALIKAWITQTAEIYLHVKDAAGV